MQCRTKKMRVYTVFQRGLCLTALTGLLVGCGGGSDGAAVGTTTTNSTTTSNSSSGSEGASGGGTQVQVSSQTIAFGNVPVLNYHATASERNHYHKYHQSSCGNNRTGLNDALLNGF